MVFTSNPSWRPLEGGGAIVGHDTFRLHPLSAARALQEVAHREGARRALDDGKKVLGSQCLPNGPCFGLPHIYIYIYISKCAAREGRHRAIMQGGALVATFCLGAVDAFAVTVVGDRGFSSIVAVKKSIR